MRSRILSALLIIVVLAAGAMATSGDAATPARQRAVAYLTQPTLIGLTIVQGPVLFTHGQFASALVLRKNDAR